MICRQIVASVDSEATGPTYSVTSLSAALRARGIDSAVNAIGQCSEKPGIEIFPKDTKAIPVLNKLWFSGALRDALGHAAKQGAILHSHGLWLMPAFYSARAARRHGVPLITAPRGMLSEQALTFSSRRKKLVWMLAQRNALEAVSCFHATSEAEREEIRRAGLTAPVAVIPNGIHIPSSTPTPERTILHLGRLHPKKGIDRLIAAWAQIAGRHPNWRLRIVGPSENGHREELEAQVYHLDAPRVDFDGPLYGNEKWEAYANAGLFVLPTLNENFGMVVAEALASGVPTICTKGGPWQRLVTERCGWWVDHQPEPMAAAIDAALGLPQAERTAMGMRGRAWMARDFGWDSIAAQMEDVYAWCLGNAEKPECVTV